MTESNASGKGRLGLILAVVAIAAFAAFTWTNVKKARHAETETVQKEKIAPVALAEARTMTFDRVLDLTGEIRPWRDVMILPKIPGQVIESVIPEKGDEVKKGDTVAVLDDSGIRARIEEADAGLAAARAGLSQAEASLGVLEKDQARLAALFREKAVARQKLDHLTGQVQASREMCRLAEARIHQAEAVRRQLAIALKDHRVTAPEGGIVSARYVDAGNLSSPTQPILRLADETRVKILTFATEKDFSTVKKGMAARIRVDAYPDAVFEGSVTLINPVFNPATRSNDIEIHIPNTDGRLRSGMFARVRLNIGTRTVTAVERDAVLRMAGTGSDTLFTVTDGRAVLKNVVIGTAHGRYVEIAEGLAPGEKVVVAGHGTLRDGARVIVSEPVKTKGAVR